MHKGIRNSKQREHNEYFGERRIMVRLECSGESVPEVLVSIENIEEDIQRRDVLTFKCPACGQSHKSLRFG